MTDNLQEVNTTALEAERLATLTSFEIDQKAMRLENEDKRHDAQRNMAWFALFGMLLYPFAVVIASWIGLDRAASTLGDMAPTYFVSVAAIVAAFYAGQALSK